MKKLFLLIGCLCFMVAVTAHEIDSLYSAFLTSRGESTVRLANEIVAMTGDTTRFTMGTSADEMHNALLKTLIFWHFDRAEMVEVVNYSNKAIERYRQQDDLFDMAGCYNTLGVAYQRMGQLEEAINSYNQCNIIMDQLNEKEPNPFYQRNIRYTTNNMAAIYSSMGELDRAEDMNAKCTT